MMELVSTPNPHFIPGYTGSCPQYRYRLGDTYGTTTHKVLLDPSVCHAHQLVLSDRIADDYTVHTPATRDIDVVNEKFGGAVFKHPTIPGYEGFLPREHGKSGQRYRMAASEALADHEKLQKADKAAQNQITKIGYQEGDTWNVESLDDSDLTKSEFKLPLLEVRPECATLQRSLPVVEPPLTPPRQSVSPYYLENSCDPQVKSGATGHVPFGYAAFGKRNEPINSSTLCDFVTNYRKRLSTEWAPAQVNKPDPPVLIQPSEIYHRHIGQVPNYGGHIPGAIFRYGKTYGNDSRDAKRWLRGDFS